MALRVRNTPDLEQMNQDLRHVAGSTVNVTRGPDGPHIQTCMPTDVVDSKGDVVTEDDPAWTEDDVGGTCPQVKLNAMYRLKLRELMLHQCKKKYGGKSASGYYPCKRDVHDDTKILKYCKKGFPKHYQDRPTLTDTGYPIYMIRPLDPVDDKDVIEEIQGWIESGIVPPELETVDDIVRSIVPHCRELLEALDCHVNVEWAHSVGVIKYLYKYFYKHDTVAKMAVRSLDGVDQVTGFLNAQRTSATEAAWKILGFQINRRSCTVESLQTHMPNDQWVAMPDPETLVDEETYDDFIEQLSVTTQERYLGRPDNTETIDFDTVTYAEYYERFQLYNRAHVPKHGRNSAVMDQVQPISKRKAVVERFQAQSDDMPSKIARIKMKSPTVGPGYYLRQLLHRRLWKCKTCATHSECKRNFAAAGALARPDQCIRDFGKQPRTYEDIRTGPTGILHTTFEESAMDYDILKGKDAYTSDFLEQVAEKRTSRQLFDFYVFCVCADGPFETVRMWQEHGDLLSHDQLLRLEQGHQPGTGADDLRLKAREITLTMIDEHLRANNTSAEKHELPVQTQADTELERYKNAHPPGAYTRTAAAAQRPVRPWTQYPDGWRYEDRAEDEPALTEEQQPIFDSVMGHINSPNSSVAANGTAVTARAGRGKTWLMNLIVACARSANRVVLCVAATAIAASQFPGGRTAHSQFKIPVSDGERRPDAKVVCTLQHESGQADFLKSVDLIVWDEILNQHGADVVAVDELLQELKGNTRPFGGIPVLFGGDVRQIPPIVQNSSQAEHIVAATVLRTNVWRQLAKHELVKPVRDAEDPTYSAYVDSLGDGTAVPVEYQGTIRCETNATRVGLPPSLHGHTGVVYTEDALIDATYGSNLHRLNTHPQDYVKHAIMCTTNHRVKEFNSRIVERMAPPGVRSCLSLDCIDNGDDMHPEVIDMIGHRPGVPEHELVLFPGAIVRVMRNFSVSHGLLNGTRCKVAFVDANVVGLFVIGRKVLPHTKPFLIPRIKFKERLKQFDSRSVHVYRMQFPLTLAYAMTYNKSQGLTMDKIGIDVREPSFSHGHTYVAFGRARRRSDVVVLISPDVPSVVNVVYKALLAHLRPAGRATAQATAQTNSDAAAASATLSTLPTPPPPKRQCNGLAVAQPRGALPNLTMPAPPKRHCNGLANACPSAASSPQQQSSSNRTTPSTPLQRWARPRQRATAAGGAIVETPQCGQCAFNALARTQIRAPEIHPLRVKTVKYVLDNWTANPNIAYMLPVLGELCQGELRLQFEFSDICVHPRGRHHVQIDEYVEHMMDAATYAELRELAIAAFLEGVRLHIVNEMADGQIIDDPQSPVGQINSTDVRCILRVGEHYEIYYPPTMNELSE